LLTSTAKMVRAGVIEEPGWLKVFQRMPPQMSPPREKSGVPKIILPTDRLFRIRETREESTMPIYAHGELQSSTLMFAQRQLALINQGVPEQEAYKQVEESQIAYRAEALAQVATLTSSIKEEGASIPLLLNGKAIKHIEGSSPMEQYALWRQRMADQPYETWELGQQVMLDHWICKSALAWSWEQERFLFDEDFEAELKKLRLALFPELDELAQMTAEEREAHEMAAEHDEQFDEMMDIVDWEDQGINDRMNAWYVSYGKWQTRSFVEPKFSAWNHDQVEEFDKWIGNACLKPSMLAGKSEEDISELIVSERHSLFPRLNPKMVDNDSPVHDMLPPIAHVRRVVILNMNISDIPFALPDELMNLEGLDELGDDATEEDIELLIRKNKENQTVEEPVEAGSAYQTSPGMTEIRDLQAKGRPDGVDEGDGNFDEEEEEEETEFTRMQTELEEKEAKLVKKAERDELWITRDAELEIEMGKVEEARIEKERSEALKFALPELAHFNVNPFAKLGGDKKNQNKKQNQDQDENQDFKK